MIRQKLSDQLIGTILWIDDMHLPKIKHSDLPHQYQPHKPHWKKTKDCSSISSIELTHPKYKKKKLKKEKGKKLTENCIVAKMVCDPANYLNHSYCVIERTTEHKGYGVVCEEKENISLTSLFWL